MDPIELVWTAIGLIGLWASGRLHHNTRMRLAARRRPDGTYTNGPRLYHARGRIRSARLHFAAFAAWTWSGVLAILQPTGSTALRDLIIVCLIAGFALESVSILYGNVRDERLERMLARPAGTPARRKED